MAHHSNIYYISAISSNIINVHNEKKKKLRFDKHEKDYENIQYQI